MTVKVEAHAIVLQGRCGVEDAEALLSCLDAHPDLPLDLGAADMVHTALWQVMLMVQPELVGVAREKFVADHLLPALEKNFLHPDAD